MVLPTLPQWWLALTSSQDVYSLHCANSALIYPQTLSRFKPIEADTSIEGVWKDHELLGRTPVISVRPFWAAG